MLSDDEIRKALPGGGMTPEQIEAIVGPMREAYRKRPCRPAPATLYDRLRTAQKEKPVSISPEAIVYFIRCNQFVKIGFTTKLKPRLDLFQSGNPYPLQVIGYVPGGQEMEASIHRALSKNRNVGEWFRLTKPVRQTIVRLLEDTEKGPGHLVAAAGVKIEPLDERLRVVNPSGSRRIKWVKKRSKKFIVHE
jgi:hypothetical protein